MDNRFLISQIDETAKWFEEKISFIELCSSLITEICIYNKTVINFGKKYHRIYFEIKGDLPEINKPITEMDLLEHQIFSFHTLKEYFSYTSKDIDENNIELFYKWITTSCKIRLKNIHFITDIKEYIKETDSYYSQYK